MPEKTQSPAKANNTDHLPSNVRFTTGARFDHNEFANWILNESGEHFATMEDSGDVYKYEGGIYKPHGQNHVYRMVDTIMASCLSTNRGKSEVMGHIRARSIADRESFDTDKALMNLDNGLYNMRTGEFMSHTPKYMSFRKSTVVYDPAAECPNIDKFIGEVVEPHRVQTIYEMAGYALMSRKTMKRGFILHGQSNTGKTQLMNLFTNFVGMDSVCTVTPTALARDPHAAAGLFGKMLNVVDDLGVTPLLETGILKSLIGEGAVTSNGKNQPAFSFVPQVLVMWGCNQIPKTEDPNIRDKFDILKFNNVFDGDKRNLNLINEITTNEELSGFFNKAVAAIREALKKGTFTGSGSIEDRNTAWNYNSTPISMFVDTRCSKNDGNALSPKDAFYKKYVQWANSEHITPEKKNVVKKYLESIAVFSVKVANRSNPLFGRWCYLGIELLSSSAINTNTKTVLPPKNMVDTNTDVTKTDFIFGTDGNTMERTNEASKTGGVPSNMCIAESMTNPKVVVEKEENSIFIEGTMGKTVGTFGTNDDEISSSKDFGGVPKVKNSFDFTGFRPFRLYR